MVIEHFVENEKEGQYYTIPFSVPQNVIKITVKYEYYRPTKGILSDLRPTNCIDIGLMNEKGRFLGWSGSSHSEISVGEYSSTDGYITGKINPGEWRIIIGAYHVEKKGVTVKYTIDFEFAGEKLLFGDLHIHTKASDGIFDVSQIANMAREKGLDFIAVANHNNYAENFALPAVNGLTYIPAVEWTHYKGHMNFYGVKNPFEDSFIANSIEEMRKVIEKAKALGAVISVNHPKCAIIPYLWEDDYIFDMAEIWNGPMRPTNVRGIAYWTSLLKAGRKVVAVGGSDYHRPLRFVKIGNPVTGVYSPSQSAEDILDSIKKGRCFVSESKDGPAIDLKYGGFRMGDTTEYKEGTDLTVEVKSRYKVKLYLVTDKYEKEIKAGKVPLDKVKFAYIKATKKHGNKVRAVSNPIYFN
ncbi:MAG TPA: CehA/McbA family metallohydrolase [Clostridiales bacterium]|nr:CehA/McbA family metallohydrolase [Clostridiales bacterium]